MTPPPSHARRFVHGLLALFAILILLAIASCGERSRGTTTPIGPATSDSEDPEDSEDSEDTPRPIGAGPRPSAEDELNEGREAWFRRMHRTAPGVDWKAIEKANGFAAQAQRAARVDSGVQLGLASPWTEVGSSNQAGRVHCVTRSPNGQSLYAGSDRGGVWRGTINGVGWTPMSDNLFGGVNEIVVQPGALPSDPAVMVAFTDDGGVHRSINDGLSWIPSSGVSGVSAIRGVGTLQDASQTIVFFGRSSGQSAIYASTDRGASFQERWTGSSWNGSLFIPRTGPEAQSTLYILHAGQVRKSTDAGFNFGSGTTVTSGISEGNLCGSEAGSPTLYAAVKKGSTWELHRSTNGGSSFQKRSNLSDYWGPITASTTTPGLVIYGGVEAHRSTNGGSSFSIINTWGSYYGDPANKLHADMFGLYCVPNPGGGETWFFCCDGGLYQSTDQGASVQNLSLQGLGISQYYSTHTSRTTPKWIVAGSQDQGYQRGAHQNSTGPGPSTPFDQLISGDYGHLTSSDGSHNFLYCTYPGFVLIQENQGNPQLHTANFPSGSDHDWLPMVVADPLDPQAFFFCGNLLWRYKRSQLIASYPSVVHSNQNFAAGSADYMTALAFAPSDPQRAYAVNDNGVIYVSNDHGTNWTSPSGGAPSQHYFYGNAIAAHPTNKNEAVIGGSGYSAAGVIRTMNGGQSWQGITQGLPQTQVYDLAYAEDGSGDLFAACGAGPYRWNAASGQWSNLAGAFAPLTTYWSVEVVPYKGLVRFGTYGRGIWDYDLGQCLGQATSYGTACSGSGGFSPSLQWTGCPSPGDTIQLDLSSALGGSTAVLLFGAFQNTTPLGGGCTLAVFPVLPLTLNLPLVGSGPGQGGFSLGTTIPGTTISGTKLTLQAFCLDPGAPLGYTASNGVEVQVQ